MLVKVHNHPDRTNSGKCLFCKSSKNIVRYSDGDKYRQTLPLSSFDWKVVVRENKANLVRNQQHLYDDDKDLFSVFFQKEFWIDQCSFVYSQLVAHVLQNLLPWRHHCRLGDNTNKKYHRRSTTCWKPMIQSCAFHTSGKQKMMSFLERENVTNEYLWKVNRKEQMKSTKIVNQRDLKYWLILVTTPVLTKRASDTRYSR